MNTNIKAKEQSFYEFYPEVEGMDELPEEYFTSPAKALMHYLKMYGSKLKTVVQRRTAKSAYSTCIYSRFAFQA